MTRRPLLNDEIGNKCKEKKKKTFSLHYVFRQTDGQHAAKCVATWLAASMSVSVSDQW